MNDTTPAPSCRKKKLACCLGLIALLALAGAAAWLACPSILNMRGMAFGGAMQEKLAEIEQRLQALDAKLGDLGQRVDKVSGDTDDESAATVTSLQNDLTSLATLVNGLQADIKQAGSAAQNQQATLNAMAAGIAFLPLRETILSGRNFTTELAAMRQAAKDNAALKSPLDDLEPLAETGVATPDKLREMFVAQEPAILQAIGRATAQNWWQRLLASLRGLISIRPVHGGSTNDALTSAENALANGDVETALEAAQSLPSEAQDALKDWRIKAEARQKAETSLRDLTRYFAGMAAPAKKSSSDSTQGEP